MTPREWSTYVGAWIKRQNDADKRAISYAWLTANLARRREMPSLQALLTPPVEVEDLSAQEAERQTVMMDVIASRLKARDERWAQEAKEKAERGE